MNKTTLSLSSALLTLATLTLASAQVGGDSASPTPPAPAPQVKTQKEIEKSMRDLIHGNLRGAADLGALSRGPKGGDIVSESAGDVRKARENRNRDTKTGSALPAVGALGGVTLPSPDVIEALRKEFEGAVTPEQRKVVADKLQTLEKAALGGVSPRDARDILDTKEKVLKLLDGKEMKGMKKDMKQEIKGKRDKMREEVRGSIKQTLTASLSRVDGAQTALQARLTNQEKRIVGLKASGKDTAQVTQVLENAKKTVAALPDTVAAAQKAITALVETDGEVSPDARDVASKAIRAAVSAFTKAQIAVAQVARAVRDMEDDEARAPAVTQ